MPHIIVKMLRGRSEVQKADLTSAIVKDVVAIAGCGEDAISVAIEEFAPNEWAESVYRPDILNKREKLYKQPGYNPLG